MLRRIGILAVALLMAVGTAELFAQGRPGGGPGGRGGFGGFGAFGGGRDFASLLRVEEVQNELEMTDAQKEELADILTARRGGFGGFGGRGGDGEGGRGFRGGRGGDGDQPRRPRGEDGGRRQRPQRDNSEVQVQDDDNQPRRRGFGNLSEEELNRMREEREQRQREEEDKIAEVLEEAQLARLIGIYIQVNGASALTHRWVADRIELSGQQKEEIETAREESQETMRAEMRAAFQGGGNREEAFAKVRELREKADEEVMMVLTGGQRERLEEMKGEEFEMPERRFGGFGGQGGRGGFGGRPGGGDGGDGGDRPRRPQRPARDDA